MLALFLPWWCVRQGQLEWGCTVYSLPHSVSFQPSPHGAKHASPYMSLESHESLVHLGVTSFLQLPKRSQQQQRKREDLINSSLNVGLLASPCAASACPPQQAHPDLSPGRSCSGPPAVTSSQACSDVTFHEQPCSSYWGPVEWGAGAVGRVQATLSWVGREGHGPWGRSNEGKVAFRC